MGQEGPSPDPVGAKVSVTSPGWTKIKQSVTHIGRIPDDATCSVQAPTLINVFSGEWHITGCVSVCACALQ